MKRTNRDYLELILNELKNQYAPLAGDSLSLKEIERIAEATNVSDRTLRDYFNERFSGSPNANTMDALSRALDGCDSFEDFVIKYEESFSELNERKVTDALVSEWVAENAIIKSSLDFSNERYGIDQPLVVPVNYASDRSYWKNWAFCEAILTEPLTIQKLNSKFRLSVKLDEHNFAIYNNAGKEFIEHHYKRELEAQEDDSENLRSFLSGQLNQSEFIIRSLPLRWSSGGVLPIVHFKPPNHVRKSDWVLLFWRDLKPMAWTIPLGGSHDHEEHSNLTKLLFREFSEEILLVDRHPKGGRVFQKRFIHPDRSDNEYISPKFTEVQRQLRFEHDGLNIALSKVGSETEIETVRSNMEVMVTDELTRSVVVSVNPKEMGIETVKIVRFEMDDNDYILDGEFSEHEPPFLIRRPAMLLSLDFLKNLYHRTGEIGTLVNSDNPMVQECREITGLSEMDIHIFDHETTLRQKRLEQLETNPDLNPTELEFNRNYLAEYKEAMTLLNFGRSILLAPVVWKALSYYFEYDCNDR